MTQIKRIFTEKRNLCSSAQSVFHNRTQMTRINGYSLRKEIRVHQLNPCYPCSIHRTQMTQIKRIFTEKRNLCSSAQSVLSVFHNRTQIRRMTAEGVEYLYLHFFPLAFLKIIPGYQCYQGFSYRYGNKGSGGFKIDTLG